MNKQTARALDFWERAGWTAAQTFVSVLLATGASRAVDLPWELAGATAAGAAIVSLVTTLLLYLTSFRKQPFWIDLVLRLGKTFLSSLLGSFGGAQAFDISQFDWSSAFDLAVLATLAALGKGLLSRQPSTLPNAPAQEPNPSTLPPQIYAHAIS